MSENVNNVLDSLLIEFDEFKFKSTGKKSSSNVTWWLFSGHKKKKIIQP